MFHDEPDRMWRKPCCASIDDRLEELAALLAGGFLCLKPRTGCLPLTPGVKGRPADIRERGKFGKSLRFRLAILESLGPVSPALTARDTEGDVNARVNIARDVAELKCMTGREPRAAHPAVFGEA
jgi:hypothetical protein